MGGGGALWVRRGANMQRYATEGDKGVYTGGLIASAFTLVRSSCVSLPPTNIYN